MFLHENEVSQLVRLRKGEVEKASRHAWKYEVLKKESIFSKFAKSWNDRKKQVSVQQNVCCACQC